MRQLLLVTVLAFSLTTLSATDTLAGNPSPFGRKTPEKMVSVGVQPSFIFDYSTVVFFTNAGYGLTPSIALNAHFGFGNSVYNTYFGGDVRVAVFRSNNLGLDAYAGGHSGGFGSGFDFGAVANIDIIRAIGIITALDLDIITESGKKATPLHLMLGLDVALARNMGFLLNTEFALNRPAYSGISWGLIFFL